LAAEWLVKNRNDLEPRIYTLPEEIDREVASIKLARLGGGLEQLTDEQRAYLASWQEGTSRAARRGPACRWRRVRCGCDLSHVPSPGRGAALRALPRRPVAGTRAVPARARGHLARIPASGHSPRPGPPPQVPRGGSGCRRAGRGDGGLGPKRRGPGAGPPRGVAAPPLRRGPGSGARFFAGPPHGRSAGAGLVGAPLGEE